MSKRTVFVFSDWGSTSFLAHQLTRAGHPVLFYVHDPEYRTIGRGLVPKTVSTVPPKSSLVIFDGVGHGSRGDAYRRAGHLVIGGNAFDKDLEVDRAKGITVMRAAGIAVPDTKQFTDVSQAIKFLEGDEGQWFVKVSQSAASCASTCNADRDTLVRYLHWMATQPGDKSFILQAKVDGVEVSTNGWFDGHKWVAPFDGTLEDKKLMTGDVGPRTGCESNYVWMHRGGLLPSLTVERITQRLADARYVGPVDLNAIVDVKGVPHGLEWTARLGFDWMQAWVELLDRPVEQLEVFAAGQLSQWSIKPLAAATLRISVPPYPTEEPDAIKAMEGFPVDKRWITGYPYATGDLLMTPTGPSMASGSGVVGTLVQTGRDVKTMTKELLRLAEATKVPNKMYRVDPLERVPGDLSVLAKQGLYRAGT